MSSFSGSAAWPEGIEKSEKLRKIPAARAHGKFVAREIAAQDYAGIVPGMRPGETHALAIARWMKHSGWLALLLVISLALFGVFLGLYLGKNKGRYEQQFERRPEGTLLSSGILECPGDPKAYWYQTRSQTNMCIFSESADIPQSMQTTELEVQRRCSGRADCGGYIRRQTVPATQCACSATCASSQVIQVCPHCRVEGYNGSRPEYVLYSKKAARHLEEVPGSVRGPNNETVTTFFQKV